MRISNSGDSRQVKGAGVTMTLYFRRTVQSILGSREIDDSYRGKLVSHMGHTTFNSTGPEVDGRKVGHFLIPIQKSFKLIINQSWI